MALTLRYPATVCQDLYVVWAAPWLVLAYSRLRGRGRSEAVAAKTGVAEANAADDELPLVDRDETAAPKPHKESRGPAGPPLIDRAMHLLVALLPILLGTVRWYASVDAYPVSLFAGKLRPLATPRSESLIMARASVPAVQVSGFPAFCVNSRRVLKSWKEGKPWKPTSLELLRETRLLAASENASSPVLRFLARGHFNQEGDHNGQKKASSLSCDAALKGRVDVLLESLYSTPRRWASSDGSWDGDPGTITHLQFVVCTPAPRSQPSPHATPRHRSWDVRSHTDTGACHCCCRRAHTSRLPPRAGNQGHARYKQSAGKLGQSEPRAAGCSGVCASPHRRVQHHQGARCREQSRGQKQRAAASLRRRCAGVGARMPTSGMGQEVASV